MENFMNEPVDVIDEAGNTVTTVTEKEEPINVPQVLENKPFMLIPNVTPAVLNFNYMEVDNELEKRLGEYRKFVISDDANLKDAQIALKELNSLATNLENFRKTSKKTAEIPIKEFEKKCKALLSKIEAVKAPLNEAIDEKILKDRQEKANKAKKIMKELIEKSGLRPEYASKIICKEEFANAKTSQKAIKADLESQIAAMKERQDARDKEVQVIKEAVQAENGRNKIQIKEETFLKMYEQGMEISHILNSVREQGNSIYEQEHTTQELQENMEASVTNDEIVPLPDDIGYDVSALFDPQNTTENLNMPDFFVTPGGMPYDGTVPALGIVTEMQTATITPAEEPQRPNPAPNIWEVCFSVVSEFEILRELNDFLKEKQISVKIIKQEKIS